MNKIISIFIWAGIIGITLGLAPLHFLVSGLTRPFDQGRKIVHSLNALWARAIIWINPFWKCSWHGLENIDQDQTYVIVSNHQSYGDILMLFGLGVPFRWVAKKNLFYIPFLGWAMSLAGYIRLERGNLASIRKCVEESVTLLKGGISVLMFPEGTRSRDGRIGKFKNGAFRMAIQSQRPILPVIVTGTRDAIPRGTWVFNYQVKAQILVKPPIEVSSYSLKDVDRLRDKVRNIIVEGKEELEGVLPEEEVEPTRGI